jgi:Fe-S-cluster containining protein
MARREDSRLTPFEQLEALYATIPKVECQRKCQGACGPILLTRIEKAFLEQKVGYLEANANVQIAPRFLAAFTVGDVEGLLPDAKLRCRVLVPQTGHCRGYQFRPLVCRLWGVVDEAPLRCPFGCVPERWLTHEDVCEYYRKALAIQRLACVFPSKTET